MKVYVIESKYWGFNQGTLPRVFKTKKAMENAVLENVANRWGDGVSKDRFFVKAKKDEYGIKVVDVYFVSNGRKKHLPSWVYLFEEVEVEE